MTLKKIICIYL